MPIMPKAQDDRSLAWYWFMRALRKLQIQNNLKNSDVAALLDRDIRSINTWFYNPDAAGKPPVMPNLIDLRKLERQIRENPNGPPTGIHGRYFNYVELFEQEEHTEFEKRLMEQLAEVEQENEELKATIRTLTNLT